MIKNLMVIPLCFANGPNIGGSRIPLMDLSPQDGKLNSFIFDKQSFTILNDVFKNAIVWIGMKLQTELIT